MDNTGKPWLLIDEKEKVVNYAVVQTPNGLITELKIPLSAFGFTSNSTSFIFNTGWADSDKKENAYWSSLWWKPIFETPQYYQGAGQFMIAN